jgi:predicted transcriptional regulator
MIAEQYIKDGIRLRKSYIENIKEIVKLEPLINKRKKNFDDLKVEMESIVFSDKNDIRKTVELNNSLIQLDKEVKKVQELVRPFYDKIESLKSERDRLYVAIKEKYPNITDQQIENEIMERVNE